MVMHPSVHRSWPYCMHCTHLVPTEELQCQVLTQATHILLVAQHHVHIPACIRTSAIVECGGPTALYVCISIVQHVCTFCTAVSEHIFLAQIAEFASFALHSA